MSTVVLGTIDESFHQVVAAVVHDVLLRLGHEVEVREGPHPQMYPQLHRGEQHLFVDAWLPGGHGTYWEQIQDTVDEIGPLFTGARFFWAVPQAIPGELAASLEDLRKPEVIARMTTLQVQGTTPGAGLSMRSDQLVRDYGLDELGWTHELGDLQAIIDTVDRRMAAGDWFVTPLWEPFFLNDVHALRPLADPLGAFPPPDRGSLVAHRASWAALPEHTRAVLGRITMAVADVNAMDRTVNLDGSDPLAAARRWLDERGEEVSGWLA